MSKIKITTEFIKNLERYIENKSVPSNEVQLIWIGQAGFIFKFKDKLLVIDPYLSDALSKKYKGKLFPHIRLMEIPISPHLITNVDYIFCSHAHSDHMDPETISILSEKNNEVKIIVPAAEMEEAINRGAKIHQIVKANDGEILFLEFGIKITGVAAAHESLKVNENAEHYFLGYVFDFEGIRIYHSGDCTPYEGLIEKLKELEIDLALLPINGRDEYRLENNIAGNFKISEVIDVCKSAKIEHLIAHHFDMFAYNTVTKEELEDLRAASSSQLQIIIPEINIIYKIKKK
ncbi:MAG: MBL fold metallo-hydrolase [Candidatus Lokiarchaeota archaeon]|nr:MBL fold metallo-hydrolase [Candidatus Lokiarchaeota archaeon]